MSSWALRPCLPRFQYEDEVAKNPMNYDTWFDYVKVGARVFAACPCAIDRCC